MEDRYKVLQRLLNEEKCFKMICGAGNEDEVQVKKLAFIYIKKDYKNNFETH
jgi:hypothetical protein